MHSRLGCIYGDKGRCGGFPNLRRRLRVLFQKVTFRFDLAEFCLAAEGGEGYGFTLDGAGVLDPGAGVHEVAVIERGLGGGEEV